MGVGRAAFFWAIAGLLIYVGTGPATAYEVDNFTDRDTLTQDALPVLDRKINEIFDRAVRETNKLSPRYCSRSILRQEFLRWIRPDPAGILELWATYTSQIQRTTTSKSKSIYSGASFFDAPMITLAGIGRSFRVHGKVVGTDKLGHFFLQGLDYYGRVQGGEPLESVLRTAHAEDGLWGLGTSGVMSYADMATNYQGYLFWERFTTGPQAYVKCSPEGEWVRASTFTFADYVNDAWDEAINCSEFRPGLTLRVERNLARMGLGCPLMPEKCVELSKLERSEFYLSPRCKEVASRASQAQH